jgi:hypothetical protein
MLQAGRSRVHSQMKSLQFFNLPNPSSRTLALGLTQPLAEMSTKNSLLGVKRDRHLRLTNLPPSLSLLPRKCGILDISRPVTEIALFSFTFTRKELNYIVPQCATL